MSALLLFVALIGISSSSHYIHEWDCKQYWVISTGYSNPSACAIDEGSHCSTLYGDHDNSQVDPKTPYRRYLNSTDNNQLIIDGGNIDIKSKYNKNISIRDDGCLYINNNELMLNDYLYKFRVRSNESDECKIESICTGFPCTGVIVYTYACFIYYCTTSQTCVPTTTRNPTNSPIPTRSPIPTSSPIPFPTDFPSNQFSNSNPFSNSNQFSNSISNRFSNRFSNQFSR
eukprot:401823_1